MPIGQRGGNTGNGLDKNPQNINRTGRPLEPFSWAGILRQVANEELNGKTKKELIAEALFKLALSGNVQAIREFGDRVEGKAKQFVEIIKPDENKIHDERSKEVLQKIQQAINDDL